MAFIYKNKTCLSLAVSLLTTCAVANVYADTSVAAAVKSSTVKLNFRLRYEEVNDNSPTLKNANALTLRSRITLETGSYNDFSVLAEVDDITNPLSEDYNDGVNGKVEYTAISDPEDTEVNQVYLNYSGWTFTQLKWGRQRIVLDNERFIGSVAFRQNEQTYDGFTVTNKTFNDTTIFAGYISNVNRIFGEESLQGDHDVSTELLNIQYAGLPLGSFSFYTYLLDNKDNLAFSNDTAGLRLAGKRPLEQFNLNYTAEFAQQRDAADNPTHYDASYYLAEGGFGTDRINGLLGYEVLGSDNGTAGFQTPLATLHKFQGWADQFLGGGSGNIAVGIKDAYAAIKGKYRNLQWMLIYHDYTAEEATATVDDLGTEWGFSLDKSYGRYGLGFKYADYSADDSTTINIFDKRKLWLTAMAEF